MTLLIEDPVFNGVNYTATAYFMEIIYALSNGRDPGTGIKPFADWGKNLLGNALPQCLLDYNVGMQVNLYGGYPTKKDTVPLIVFAVVFGVIMLAHLTIFVFNSSRGHYFYLSLFWVFYSIIRLLGYALRCIWLKDITLVGLAVVDESFLVLGGVFLSASNLVLAQRLFSWRHPVGGARRLFRYTMYVLYGIVAGVIAMTILACAIPYLYYLKTKVFWQYKICVMASSVLIVLYALTAICLLGLSYFFKPTRKDENLYTYQPWWIESFHPFYFVQKNAAGNAEETFMKRNHNHRHAIRVIAATHHHYNMVKGLTNQRGDLGHNKSILIVTFSTLLLCVGSISRCIDMFQSNVAFRGGPVSSPTLMYITWGLLEVIINIIFLVGRVDLRFYRPDVLPRKVRAIITAEQSVVLSEVSSNLDYSDEDMSDYDFTSTPVTDDRNEYKKDLKYLHPKDYTGKESFSGNSSNTLETENGNDSEFHF